MSAEPPSLDEVQQQFDDRLAAPFEVQAGSTDRELLELMGVAGA